MRIYLGVIFSIFTLLFSSAFAADPFPNKPIRFIVPLAPGATADYLARSLAVELSKSIGQPIIVENKPGANQIIGTSELVKAAPDGYTIGLGISSLVINPYVSKNIPYDGMKDLIPLAMLGIMPGLMTIHPSLPVKTFPEFIAYAKANPGKLNYASQGNGSVSHIGTEIFKQQTGIDMVHVPYKGSGAAIQDVLAGQVQVFITTPPSVMGHVQTGKLKALAVTGKSRHPMMPTVPTVAEAGLPGFQLESWVALYVAAGTPPNIIEKLSQSVKAGLELPEVKQRADAAGVELRYLPPAEMTKLLNQEITSWSKAIKSANIKLD